MNFIEETKDPNTLEIQEAVTSLKACDQSLVGMLKT